MKLRVFKGPVGGQQLVVVALVVVVVEGGGVGVGVSEMYIKGQELGETDVGGLKVVVVD